MSNVLRNASYMHLTDIVTHLTLYWVVFYGMDKTVGTIPLRPNQPKAFRFPKRSFGQKTPVQRSFQASWFDNKSWLHYDESQDLAFCHLCMTASSEGKLSNNCTEKTFISKGFCNWKDALPTFKKHENSNCHKEATERLVTLPQTTRDIGESLSAAYKEEKSDNRDYLFKVVTSIRYLARQSLALRGDGDEMDGNFNQLLKLRGEDDPKILEWISKKREKYTCGDIQNEILQMMSTTVSREIADDIRKSNFFTIMGDETADSSNREQLVIVLRHVDADLMTQEEFICLDKVATIDSNTLTRSIKDALVRLNLSINNCRGQCYDGASNMSGAKTGVAKQIRDVEKKAVYTHCYGHALNLAAGDCIKRSKVMRDALETTYEISKLLKYSPKRDHMFEELKKEMAPETPGFRTLCPTRWTVRANSLKSVVDNYTVFQDLWDDCRAATSDTEIRARINGVDAQMQTFDFLFGVLLGHLILRHTDNLSRTLQQKDLSAAEGQEAARLTLETLLKMRKDDAFSMFWTSVNKQASNLEVDEPRLPRKRKMPKRYQEGDAAHFFPTTPEDCYRQKYYEALDLATSCIRDRFDQPGYKIYKNAQELLQKAVNSEFPDYTDQFNFVVEFYEGDLDGSVLKLQLETLKTGFEHQGNSETVTLHEVLKYLRSLSPAMRCMFSEVVTLAKLILVMPATNATSERTFSALRRVKTYLRSTMTQNRLNSLMILHVHKERTDALDVHGVVGEFVSARDRRLAVFGK